MYMGRIRSAESSIEAQSVPAINMGLTMLQEAQSAVEALRS